MREVWKKIEGYNGVYSVSNLGRIKSHARTVKMTDGKIRNLKEKILKQANSHGYLQVGLSKDGKNKMQLVHRIVALTFKKKPNGKNVVNHIDGNKKNNRTPNLEWCTTKENIQHASKALGKMTWTYNRRK